MVHKLAIVAFSGLVISAVAMGAAAAIGARDHQLAGDAGEREFRGRRRIAARPIADTLTAPDQQRRQRQQQQIGARLLSRDILSRREIHVGAAVAPQPHRLRRFPFTLADIEMLRLCGLAPVDGRHRVLGAIAAKLPEAFAGAGAAAAMHAQTYARSEMVGLHQQRRQGCA